MIKCAIFDLDGVVAHTEIIHFQAWQKAFAEFGIDITESDYFLKIDGKDRYSGAKSILNAVPDALIKTVCSKKQSFFIELLKNSEINPYTDVISFIYNLKQNKKKVGLASSSRNAILILEKTRTKNIFDTIVIADTEMKSKPHPDIFLITAAKMNMKPGEVVVFEDSIAGIKAAKNADMFCVGVNRYPSKKILKDADILIHSFENFSLNCIIELHLGAVK